MYEGSSRAACGESKQSIAILHAALQYREGDAENYPVTWATTQLLKTVSAAQLNAGAPIVCTLCIHSVTLHFHVLYFQLLHVINIVYLS